MSGHTPNVVADTELTKLAQLLSIPLVAPVLSPLRHLVSFGALAVTIGLIHGIFLSVLAMQLGVQAACFSFQRFLFIATSSPSCMRPAPVRRYIGTLRILSLFQRFCEPRKKTLPHPSRTDDRKGNGRES